MNIKHSCRLIVSTTSNGVIVKVNDQETFVFTSDKELSEFIVDFCNTTREDLLQKHTKSPESRL